MTLMRADKLLASAGVGTRTEVKKIIKAGRLKRDEIPVRNPEEKLDPDTMHLTLDDTPFCFAANEYWVLSKPAGVLSATEDRRHETVISYMGLQRKGLAPCGRLDIDTEGLLLVTDDGALVIAYSHRPNGCRNSTKYITREHSRRMLPRKSQPA